MRYKTMYGLHEARMWLTTIISGVVAGAAILAANPEIKEKATNKLHEVKDKVGGIFKKKKKDEIKIVVVDEKGNPLR